MSRGLGAVGIFAAAAAVSLWLGLPASHQSSRIAGEAGSGIACGSRTCPKNTHCCFDCRGNPLCLKPGVMCPVCPAAAPGGSSGQ